MNNSTLYRQAIEGLERLKAATPTGNGRELLDGVLNTLYANAYSLIFGDEKAKTCGKRRAYHRGAKFGRTPEVTAAVKYLGACVSVTDIAEACGVGQTAVSNWLAGRGLFCRNAAAVLRLAKSRGFTYEA